MSSKGTGYTLPTSLTESELCKHMMGVLEFGDRKSPKLFRLSFVKSEHPTSPFEVQAFCTYGWMSTIAYEHAEGALDYIFTQAEAHNLESIAYHSNGNLTFYRF